MSKGSNINDDESVIVTPQSKKMKLNQHWIDNQQKINAFFLKKDSETKNTLDTPEIYTQMINLFEEISELSNEKLLIKIDKNLEESLETDVESYWIEIYKSNKNFKDLARFFINICLLTHSSCTVERFYS